MNLNVRYANTGQGSRSWWGLVVFIGVTIVAAAAWVLARPMFLRPIASRTGPDLVAISLMACLRGARAAWRGQPWFLDRLMDFARMGPRNRRAAVLAGTLFFAGLGLLGVAAALAGIIGEHPAADWIIIIVNIAAGLTTTIVAGFLVGTFVEFTNGPDSSSHRRCATGLVGSAAPATDCDNRSH